MVQQFVGQQIATGIKLFRLYIKCPRCAAEIITKTDPQDSDYAVEYGAVRNFEPWREEAEGDATEKSLEDKALESKRDMEILAGLKEMKSMKSRRATVTVDDMLAALKRRSGCEKEKIQDEEAIHFVRRIKDDDDEDGDFRRDLCLKSYENRETLGGSSICKRKFLLKPRGLVNKKTKFEVKVSKQNLMDGLQSLCQNYDSD